MPWVIVPLDKKDFGYFDRQRDLFSGWRHLFDDTWQDLGLEDSQERFNRELDRVRGDMHRMDVQPVVLDVQHPFIIDPEGNHKFCLRFNCSQFKPEEIEVKTMDNTLKVHAKHVQETEGRKIHQEFTREYALPENVDPDKLTSHLSEDGVLQIEAPVPPPPEVKAPKEILIPIQHLESKKKPKEAAAETKTGEKEPKEGEEKPKEVEKEPEDSEKEPKEGTKETKEEGAEK
ncbi:heat shock protein 27-like [Mercenaria mercenaria]|uniref:heat shock protein 27-like n=1 Tax=Mercenaria mercenaria TaxID=6596 RepID=UPI00234F7634|nr:heat shock protein 27-like [Mercenaria mercenaria]